MAMLMSLVVAGKLTCDVEIKETAKGIKYYLLVLYLATYSKDQQSEPHRVKIKANVNIEQTWVKDAKKGDPVTIAFDKGARWWGGDGIIVVSGWTSQVRLHKPLKKEALPPTPPADEELSLLSDLENVDSDIDF